MYKVWNIPRGCFCFGDEIFKSEKEAENRIKWLLGACKEPGLDRCWYEIVEVN